VGHIRVFLSHYEEPFRRSLLWIALYYMAGRRALNPSSVADADLWWHLRTGDWIVQHHWVPYADSFSSYGMGRPWAAYSWLFEVLVSVLYADFGLLGLLVFVCTVTLLLTWLLHKFIREAQPDVAKAILLAGIAVFAMAPDLTPRPWLFTILLFLIELKILTTVRRSRDYKRLFWLPAVFALWANFHIQFVYGLVVLAVFTAEGIISHLVRRLGVNVDEDEQPLPFKFMMLVSMLCLLATLINPYHFRLYSVLWETFKLSGLYSVISELKAMEFRTLTDWFVLALAVGAAFTLGREAHRKPIWTLLLVISAFVCFRSRRDIWFCVLLAVTIIAYAPVGVTGALRYVLSKAQTAFVVVTVTTLLLLTIKYQNISQNQLNAEVARVFPVRAATFVADKGYAGPLFNDFNWGGYLMWRLPYLPVAIDGRSHLHDAQRIDHFAMIWEGNPNWSKAPELNDARLVIAEKYAPLTQLLRLDRRFELIYEDDVAVVFTANSYSTSVNGQPQSAIDR
jgi:hypothetical protein